MALKHCLLWIRPSRVLGLFFVGQLCLLLGLVWWRKLGTDWLLFGITCPELELQNWLFLTGIEAAVAGWVVTSFMTLRNSIKQHTINTLLQSRLSATYMEHAGCINKKFFPPNALTYDNVPLEFFLDEANYDVVKSVSYLINYFEFMSVAIRHGDLDQKLLKHTVGGILVRFYTRMELFIKYQRGDDGKTIARESQLEHMTWLYNKWRRPSLVRRLINEISK